MDHPDDQAKAAGFLNFDHFFKNVSFYKSLLRKDSRQHQKLLSELQDSEMRERLRALPGGQRVENGRVRSGVLSKVWLVGVLILAIFQRWWLAIGALVIWYLILRPFHKMTKIEAMARVWAIKEPLSAEDIEGFRDAFASMESLKSTLRNS